MMYKPRWNGGQASLRCMRRQYVTGTYGFTFAGILFESYKSIRTREALCKLSPSIVYMLLPRKKCLRCNCG